MPTKEQHYQYGKSLGLWDYKSEVTTESSVDRKVARTNAIWAEHDATELRKKREKQQASLRQDTPTQVNNTPILKSTLLKNEKNMNALAKGSFSSLSMGMRSFEILKAQEALKEVGTYQGKADGRFGGLTEQSVKVFQKEYCPSHVSHKQYNWGVIDGIVGKNTVFALDEAVREEWKIPILKSSILNDSKHLNQLADGKFNALKNGSRDKSEIEKVQDALIELGFNLGTSGADGNFGGRTEKAVRQFQENYEPTHATHESYQFGEVDGIVGKNTIFALDEAVREGWKSSFMFTLEMLQTVYPRVASSKQDLLKGIVDELNAHIKFYKLDTPLRRSHFFAQIMHETGSWLSIEELFRYSCGGLTGTFTAFKKDNSLAKELSYDDSVKGKNTKRNGELLSSVDFERIANIAYGGRNGNSADGDGWKYRGRGLKQLTGKDNYRSFTKWHSDNSEEWPEDVGLSFVEAPDLLLDIKYAVRSAAFFWVKHKLYSLADNGSDYSVSKSITHIINPGTDKVSRQARFDHFNKLVSKGVFE